MQLCMFSDLPPDIPIIGVYICVFRQKGPGNWAMTQISKHSALKPLASLKKRQNNSFMILGFA